MKPVSNLKPVTSPKPLHQRPLVGPSVLDERRETEKKMILDAVKLRTEAMSGHAGARGVNGAIKLVSGVQKANAGDQFHAAASLSSAMEKLTPVLSKSVVGATTSAVVLATANAELRESRQAIKENLEEFADESLDHTQRVNAGIDAAVSASVFANVARSVGKAAMVVGRYAGRVLKQVPAFAPAVVRAEAAAARIGATQIGRSLAFLNKWIPLLNVAWVALSVKTAIEVHKDPAASGMSKGLSLVALGMSTAVFGAGVALGPWAFAGITVGSIGADLALAYSRRKDQAAKA